MGVQCAARACGADRIEVGFGLKSEFSPPVKKSACERLPFGNLSQSFMRSTIRSSAPERARNFAGTFNRSPAFTLFPGRPTRAAPLFLGLSSRICPIISRSTRALPFPTEPNAPRRPPYAGGFLKTPCKILTMFFHRAGRRSSYALILDPGRKTA